MTVELYIFLQPVMWSTRPPRFCMLGSGFMLHSTLSRNFSGTGRLPRQTASSSMQTYWRPVCWQLQRRVRHWGRTTMGSPLTMQRLVEFFVRASKWLAQLRLATRGEPKLMTSTCLKMRELATSMQEMTERPPPRLMPVMQTRWSPVCCWMSRRSLRTLLEMASHMFLQAFWILQLEQMLESTTWLAQRMSCQTLRRVLVQRKASTTKVGQVARMHLMSFSFSQMQCECSGRLLPSHTLHSQFIRSVASSFPTIIEFASSICSRYGSPLPSTSTLTSTTTVFRLILNIYYQWLIYLRPRPARLPRPYHSSSPAPEADCPLRRPPSAGLLGFQHEPAGSLKVSVS